MAVSGGRSPVAGHRLLAAVASLVAERGLEGTRAQKSRLADSVAAVHRPCSTYISPDQGSNL